MARVMGAARLVLLAIGTGIVALVAVLVIGPWGWTEGIEVSHGPALSGPAPEPDVAPDVVYRSADGSIEVRDDTYRRIYGADYTVRFDVSAVVRPDHTVEITEDITQVFATPGRRGIERLIPLADEAGEHAMRSLVVSTSPGTPDDVSVADGTGFDGVRIRVGDPDTTITGTHRYRLTYVLENAVSVPPATTPLGDALSASPTGAPPSTAPPTGPVERFAFDAFSEWRQPIYGSVYTVVGPDGAVAQRCYQATVGIGKACTTEPATTGGTFRAVPPVIPSEAFTVEVDWPEGTFAAAAIEGPERGTWAVRGAAVALALVGVAVVGAAAIGRARLLWARTRQGVVATFGGAAPEPASELVPRSAGTPPPVELVPPMGLRPAELLRLEEGAGADHARLLAATIIDLAASGHLELRAGGRDEDWQARRGTVAGGRELRPFERHVLELMVPDEGEWSRFGDRAPSMGKARDEILRLLDDELVERGLLARRLGSVPSGCGSRVVGAMVVFALAVGVLGVGGGVLLGGLLPWRAAMLVAGAVIGLAVALWGLAGVARAGRDHTTTGLGARYRADGFRRFFDESEELHARAAADTGLLRQYMGYAVAFDAVDRCVGAFAAPDLTWMGTSDVAVLSGWVHGATLTRAATPPPPPRSSSSSSSFGGFGGGFGGGGGGGSGGGGGGSW